MPELVRDVRGILYRWSYIERIRWLHKAEKATSYGIPAGLLLFSIIHDVLLYFALFERTVFFPSSCFESS